MHDRFAQRIANQIHIRKWKLGWKAHQLAGWLQDRFPNLSQEDSLQIKKHLPKK